MKGNLLNYKEKDFFLNIKQQRRDYFYIYFYFYEALRPFLMRTSFITHLRRF